MAELLVINTGPIITLGKMGALEVVRDLPYTFLTSKQVLEELDAGRKKGYVIGLPEWIQVEGLRDPLRLVDQVTLGKGEASVIQLALERGVSRVCIDETKGRRVAATAGLGVLGVLGLLGRAKILGRIEAMKPFLEKAVLEGVRYDERLIQRVLVSVGEV